MRRFSFLTTGYFSDAFRTHRSRYILRHIGILIRKNLYRESYHHSFSQQFITLRALKLD